MAVALSSAQSVSTPPAALATVRPIRVMLVDDSLTVRTVFGRMISKEKDLEVVADAGTAEKAIMALRSKTVDVILLDLEMPGMGGIEALPKLLERAQGGQILVVSSLTESGAEHTVKAMQLGAADTMLKPRPGQFNDEYRDALLAKIRALGEKAQSAAQTHSAAKTTALPPASAAKRRTKPAQIVAIGASTGGIHALNLFLRRLPENFRLPILITQHLPDTFMPVFARQMEIAARRPAVVAHEGLPIQPGMIIVAPGDAHMVVRRTGIGPGAGAVIGLAQHRASSGCMPSVDPMFESLASCYDGHVAAVVLSGMGRDGTEGAQFLARAGAAIYAQDQLTSAVWGMPRGVVDAGLATAIAGPEALAESLLNEHARVQAV